MRQARVVVVVAAAVVALLGGSGSATATGGVSFAAATHYGTGQQPWLVTTGDFNGDGKIDVALPDLHASAVSILLGNGDGTFAAESRVAVGANPGASVAGDFNGDGHTDLAVVNGGDATVTILLGDGHGAFTAAATYPIGGQDLFNSGIAAGDLNGDGSLDLVAANGSDGTVSILLGTGDGTFATASPVAVGAHPELLALADVNGDGNLDLVSTASGDNAVSVLLGNGDGSFGPPTEYPVGANPSDVAVGDLNHDGKPDLVVTNYDAATVSVLLGNGDGTFAAQTAYTVGSNPESVAITDLDHDGNPDVAVSDGGDNDVSVLLGNSDGTLTARTSFATGAAPLSLATADLDGNGLPDLLTADATDNTISTLLNTTGTAASGGGGSGGLQELSCIAETNPEGCGTTSGAGLEGADWIATSPDGKNVYVASFDIGIAEFARAADGSLTELGCVSATAVHECGSSTPTVLEPTSITVSPDGKNVYVTDDEDDLVAVFDRAADGTLAYDSCIQDVNGRSQRGCGTTVHGMVNPYDVVVSPDGSNAYVAAGGSGAENGAVVELARASGGSLSQLAPPNDCIEETGSTDNACGTTDGAGLLAATALAISADGTSVYAVADTHAVRSGDAPGAIAELARDPSTGALTEIGCIGEATSVSGITECQSHTAAGLSDLVNVAVSADGKTVYTASDDDSGPIAELSRAADGTLTPLGCIDGGGGLCGATAAGLNSAFGLAVSPDGGDVYVAAAGTPSVQPGLVELARAGDGTLSASTVVSPGNGLGDALGVAVSPDGANVYTAASSDFVPGTLGHGGAVAWFSRAGGSSSGPPTNQPPTAAFTSSVSGLSVGFDASGSSDSDGTIASYAWDFGDGQSGTGATPTHAYATAGTYTVTLTVTESQGATAKVSHTVTVSAPTDRTAPPGLVDITTPLVARIAVTPASGSRRTSFTIDGSGSTADGGVTSYGWDFGDGTFGTGASAVHSYARPGTYTIVLVVTDKTWKTATARTQVTVANAPPTASFVYLVPRVTSNAGAPSRTVTFVSTSTDDGRVVSERWRFGDGKTGRGARVSHTYRGTAKRFAVKLTVRDDDGATETVTGIVKLASPPPVVVDDEVIVLGDTPGLIPPLTISVDEGITVPDVPQLTPPQVITVTETIGTGDGGRPGNPPPSVVKPKIKTKGKKP